MPIAESVKKKATSMANSVVAKADESKFQKQLSTGEKITKIDAQIKTLAEAGGFESTIERLEKQKNILKNLLRNAQKK